MDTGGKTGILSGGGGGIYHGFDGNRAGYDLSAYHNNYVPQETGNHAMQRLSPLSGGKRGKRGRPRATRRGVQRWQLKKKPTTTMKLRRRHKSARVLAMEADPDSVWGKNKPLEKFWQDLASGRKVVLIKKNGGHKMYTMPKSTHDYLSEYYANQYDTFNKDPDIVAVLTSYRSQDAYELHLYPKAKDATVEYVIKHYKRFFRLHTKLEPKTYMP